MGSFSTSEAAGNITLNYIPSAGGNSAYTARVLSQYFYRVDDKVNVPLPLTYGNVSDSASIIEYNGVKASRSNNTKCSLTNNTTPIFVKSFNPSDSNIISIGSSIFYI